MRVYHVYILSNVKRNVMYVGVTNDLENRVGAHREGIGGVFARRHQLNTLVYAEKFEMIEEAIAREKEIKSWRRSKKDALVEALNPTWADLLDPGTAKDPPEFTNEVQHLLEVLPWESTTISSRLRSAARLPVFMKTGNRCGKSRQLWIARHRRSLAN